jgi:pentatricopeptide repeat protein
MLATSGSSPALPDRCNSPLAGRLDVSSCAGPTKIEQISDKSVRDSAIYQVLNFCMKARDVENAERLFRQIQTAWIAERVKSEHPMFGAAKWI